MRFLLLFMTARATAAWIMTTDPKLIGAGLLLALIGLVVISLALLKRAPKGQRWPLIMFSATSFL